MESLFNKFTTNRLSPDELIRFRNMLNQMSDTEIQDMLNRTESFDNTLDDNITDERLDVLKQVIDIRNGHRATHLQINKHIARAVAALIVIIMSAGIYFYIQSNNFNNYKSILVHENVLSVPRGEKATAILPDGSTIMLSGNSSLSYSLTDFNSNIRRVTLKGNALFDVAHDDQAPFIISTGELEVKVLGTLFFLATHSTRNSTQLYLDKGTVQICSMKFKRNITLSPHQLITFNTSNGSYTITDINNTTESESRLRGDIFAESEPLGEVAAQLSMLYNKTFTINPDVTDDYFTGRLPGDNLHEVINILSHSYRVTIHETSDTIALDL